MIIRIMTGINSLLSEKKENLVLMYRECFLEPPRRETFFYNTISTYFEWMFSVPDVISILCLSNQGQVMGASFAYPVIHNQEISDFLVEKGIEDQSKIIYLAEFFVGKEHRNRGIGKALHRLRIVIAKMRGMNLAVERTSPASKMFSMILKDGFTPIGGMEVMSLKNFSGTQIMAPDARVVSNTKI
ncbi:MAG: GNAT family N-acetyltransferase [Candidatus Magasanikbacteria bacterium]|nr:GNAT family N-acetyltransferase [Candidatus Magasanikbacteria bacterium]